MRLSTRLALSFAILCIFSITLAGYMAFRNSRQTIEQESINHLVATNMLKEAELNRWFHGLEQRLRDMARRPEIIEFSSASASKRTDDPDFRMIRNRIMEDHFFPTLEEKEGFFAMMIIRKDDGLVLASSEESLEGKYREHQPYFTEGKKQTFIQHVYYSMTLQQAAMVIGTPIKDKKGRLVAVLAGRVDISVLSRIIGTIYSLNQTEDAYLVNAFNFFVTEPRFGKGYALKKSIHTTGVVECLTHRDVTDFYTNYHGVPVIGVYRWLPERDMCLVNEIQQAEVFRPISVLKNNIAAAGAIIAILAALTGWIIARTIILPLRQLVKATENIGSGNLEYQIATAGRDETGDLSRSFTQMTKRLKETLVSRNQLAKEVKERKQAEYELRESSRRLALVMDSIDALVYVADMKTYEVLFINKYGRKIFEDVTGQKCWKIFHEGQDGPCSFCTNDKLLNSDGAPSGVYVWEYENITNKHWYDCRDQAIIWNDGRMVRMEIASDITERKRHEEELKNIHKLLLETQAITRLGGWEYDVATSRMTWTDEVYRIYAVDPSSYDPNDVSCDIAFYSHEDGPVIKRAFRRAVEMGEPYDLEANFIRADGQCIWVWTTGKPFIENGKVVRVTGNIMDITEKKLIEKKRLELEYQVQQAKKRESLFTMAGAIAHNFNNLFTVILANLELAKEFLPSNLPGVEEVLAAEKSARRAAELSLLMLTFVGCTAMHKESLDMAVIVRRLLPGIQSDIPVNVRLEYDIEPGEFFVTMVPIEARKVVMNLVTNALEAVGKREGTIRIAVCFIQDDKLFIGVNHSDISPGPGPWVCLEVADNGEGMDTETQAKMFDPFFSTKFVGRGLGLAVILGIVRACEGMIFVDSELHRGTVIRVFLPATQIIAENQAK
jgi:signal transduction histidine kinase